MSLAGPTDQSTAHLAYEIENIVKEKMVSIEWDSLLQVRPGTT